VLVRRLSSQSMQRQDTIQLIKKAPRKDSCEEMPRDMQSNILWLVHDSSVGDQRGETAGADVHFVQPHLKPDDFKSGCKHEDITPVKACWWRGRRDISTV